MGTDAIRVADHVRAHAAATPDAIALIFEGRETSYAALDRQASRVANGLIAAGYGVGDRISYLGKNRDDYFGLWLGTVKAGLVMVPVNWRLAPPEVAYILADARPRLIVVILGWGLAMQMKARLVLPLMLPSI